MRKYSLTYSIMGTGNLTIHAKSKLLAEEALFDFSIEDLIVYSDFSDGIEIVSIKGF